MQIQSSNDLLNFLITKSDTGERNWFSRRHQTVATINAAHEIAKYHADKLSPEEVVDYVIRLNEVIFEKIIIKKVD